MKARFDNCGLGPAALASQPLCYAALMLEITNSVMSSLELDQVLNKSVESIIRKLGVYGVALFLVSDSDKLRLKVSNLLAVAESNSKVDYLDGILAKVVDFKQAEYSADLGAETCFPPSLSKDLTGRSGYCFPLIAKEKFLGVLWVIDEEQHEYSQTEKDLFQGISGQIALAIANAREYARVEMLSNIDGLTGLYNHRHFHEQLKREVLRASRKNVPLSMLMLDVDYFKQYNDLFGHPAGDKLLQSIAQVCKDCLRKSDMVARYGGEEFAIILPETTSSGAMEVAERIRLAIAGGLFAGSKKMPKGRITVSLGVSTFPEHAADPVQLIKAADQALYLAKTTRNCSVVYSKIPVTQEELML